MTWAAHGLLTRDILSAWSTLGLTICTFSELCLRHVHGVCSIPSTEVSARQLCHTTDSILIELLTVRSAPASCASESALWNLCKHSSKSSSHRLCAPSSSTSRTGCSCSVPGSVHSTPLPEREEAPPLLFVPARCSRMLSMSPKTPTSILASPVRILATGFACDRNCGNDKVITSHVPRVRVP